jgi:hypothetical protein
MYLNHFRITCLVLIFVFSGNARMIFADNMSTSDQNNQLDNLQKWDETNLRLEGEKLSYDQLMKLKQDVLSFFNTPLKQDKEEYYNLYSVPFVLLSGLFKQDKNLVVDLLDDLKININTLLEKRGMHKKYDGGDNIDSVICKKIILISRIFNGILIFSIDNKDFDFYYQCFYIFIGTPFVNIRQALVKGIITIYNHKDADASVKEKANAIIEKMIQIEESFLSGDNHNEDVLYSDSASKYLLDALRKRSDSSKNSFEIR